MRHSLELKVHVGYKKSRLSTDETQFKTKGRTLGNKKIQTEGNGQFYQQVFGACCSFPIVVNVLT